MLAEELSHLLGQPINPHREENAIKCPLHDDTHASASVNLRKGVWNCQGCGKGGSLEILARFLGGEISNIDLVISRAQGSLIPEDEPTDFTELYSGWTPILPTTPESLTYARDKGLRFDTLENFGVRHNKSGVLAFPYFDGERIAALRYRGRNGEKWFETGSERLIYNLNEVRGAGFVILAEGESDTHALWNKLHGTTAWAIGGIPGANSSRATWELWSLDLMWAEKILIAFDNDEAGEKGFDRAAEVLGDKARRFAPPKRFNDWAESISAGSYPLLA
jgi:hypothetical protein